MLPTILLSVIAVTATAVLVWRNMWVTLATAATTAVLISSQMWITMGVSAVVMLIVSVYLLRVAKYDKQTCYVPTGEIKLVAKGESCARIIPNLSGTGYHYNKASGIIEKGEGGILSDPLSFLGVYFVSLLYPLKQVHVWLSEYDELLPSDPANDEEGYATVSKSKYVNSLPLFFTFPIVVEGVELKGNLKINILVNVTFRAVNPTLAVFIFRGQWLAHISAAIKGVISDLARSESYDDFRKLEKEGDNSFFSLSVMKLNKSLGGVPGVIETYGMEIHGVDFEKFGLVAASKEERAAVTTVELARLEAEAAIQKARGIETLGTAHANALSARLKAAASVPYGMSILKQEIETDGIARFQGAALSLGGNMPFTVAPKTNVSQPISGGKNATQS